MRNSFASLVVAAVAAAFLVACDGSKSETSFVSTPAPLTAADFHVPGTQVGDVPTYIVEPPVHCRLCHGDFDPANDPSSTWSGSLMANAGRDPLFMAQLATAEQDVPGVGYYCQRCHVPISVVTGHADVTNGSAMNPQDAEGVSCHFCHSLVDPIYKPGISPPEDAGILGALTEVPTEYGNAMFVLDPTGLRRGPRADHLAMHPLAVSPFFRSGDLCGTCHDVGNVAISRRPDGTYGLNNSGEPSPSHAPHSQFPLERTYSEWKLSAFAETGVDMGGRFGGSGAPTTVVSTCQDCHMPKVAASACAFTPPRTDTARHEFAGSAAWVLDIIGLAYAGDPEVDLTALAAGKNAALSMLARAASLAVFDEGGALRVRVTNESGHKLPTGHIEGRRVFLNVRFYDAADQLVGEHGAYDAATADLDEASTTVYEMKIGISPEQSAKVGLPVGETTHMSLADVIEKDNRIPPRGFDNARFEAAGAPAVGTAYADGQYWHDTNFAKPATAVRADVTLYYQIVTRHYIEALRDGNVSNQAGEMLHALWVLTQKAAPSVMATAAASWAK